MVVTKQAVFLRVPSCHLLLCQVTSLPGKEDQGKLIWDSHFITVLVGGARAGAEPVRLPGQWGRMGGCQWVEGRVKAMLSGGLDLG